MSKIFGILIIINGILLVASWNTSSNHLFCQVVLSPVFLVYLLSNIISSCRFLWMLIYLRRLPVLVEPPSLGLT